MKINKEEMEMMQFRLELISLINKHSIESFADMPDFMLAQMVCDFIVGVGSHIKSNLDWHGCDSICHPKSKLTKEGE